MNVSGLSGAQGMAPAKFLGVFPNAAAFLLSLCLDLPSGFLTTRPLSMMDSFMETLLSESQLEM